MTTSQPQHYAIFVFTLLCLNLAPLLAQTTGRWITRTPMPTSRQEMSSTLFNGLLYVPGGLNAGGGVSSIIDIYDPASSQWLDSESLPQAVHHTGLRTLNGNLVLPGGYIGNFFAISTLYQLDSETNDWLQMAPMSTPRGAHVALVMAGKLYVIGGRNGNGLISSNEVYDPATNEWTTLQPMPTAREHIAGAVIDSLIYVVGGRTTITNDLTTLEAYNPATNRWSTKASMPTARSGLTAAAMNGRLYAIGGEFFAGQTGVFEENEEYDPVSNTWRTMAPLPTPRHGMGAVTVEDTIFVIGGGPVAGFGVTNVNEGFTLSPVSTESPEAIIIEDIRLFQNFPNPFNGTTQISFDLPRATRLKLTIFDVLGQPIRTIAEGTFPAGSHDLTWNATDNQGQLVSSGVYFYQLEADRSKTTRRLLYIR